MGKLFIGLLPTPMRNNSGLLKAPVRGSMDRRIPESIDAQIRLVVRDKKGILIFNDSTSIAGLELVGDQETLSKKLKNWMLGPTT